MVRRLRSKSRQVLLWLGGLLLGAVWLAGTRSHAATAPGVSTANIIQPVTLIKISDLRFGTIIAGAAVNRVTINQNSGARTASAGAATLLPGQPVSRAQFQVSGAPGAQVRVTLPANFAVTRTGGGTMTVNTLRSNTTAGLATLNAAGQFLLNIGGRLNVTANQLPGLYAANFNVTVNYQ